MPFTTTSGINPSFPGLSQTLRQVSHVLRTRSPLSLHCIATASIPLDLHVLTTSPAFTLSQDQTLQKSLLKVFFERAFKSWRFELWILSKMNTSCKWIYPRACYLVLPKSNTKLSIYVFTKVKVCLRNWLRKPYQSHKVELSKNVKVSQAQPVFRGTRRKSVKISISNYFEFVKRFLKKLKKVLTNSTETLLKNKSSLKSFPDAVPAVVPWKRNANHEEIT